MDDITEKLKRLLPMLDALEKVLIKIVSLVGWLIILMQVIGLK